MLFAAAAVLAAACSGPHRAATTTPTTTTRPNVAARYIAIANTGNRGLDRAFDGLEAHDHDDLAAARADLARAASVERRFDRELRTIAFPPALEATARALIRANEARATLASRASAAASLARLRRAERRVTAANAPVELQVKRLRRQLGLPPPPTG